MHSVSIIGHKPTIYYLRMIMKSLFETIVNVFFSLFRLYGMGGKGSPVLPPNNIFEKDFECPVCYDIMAPPSRYKKQILKCFSQIPQHQAVQIRKFTVLSVIGIADVFFFIA